MRFLHSAEGFGWLDPNFSRIAASLWGMVVSTVKAQGAVCSSMWLDSRKAQSHRERLRASAHRGAFPIRLLKLNS